MALKAVHIVSNTGQVSGGWTRGTNKVNLNSEAVFAEYSSTSVSAYAHITKGL